MTRKMKQRIRSDNSTGFKGVTRRRNGGFLARVQRQVRNSDGTRTVSNLYAEVFETAEDAAMGYDAAVRRLYGSTSAVLNFPEPGEHGLDNVRRLA